MNEMMNMRDDLESSQLQNIVKVIKSVTISLEVKNTGFTVEFRADCFIFFLVGETLAHFKRFSKD